MNSKLRVLVLAFLCLAVSSSFAGQDKLVLKTVEQKLLGAAPKAYVDNGRLRISTIATDYSGRYWVRFSADGRNLLPQLSVALADPALVERVKARFRDPKKPIMAAESFWSLQVTKSDGTKSYADERFLPITEIRYSSDLKHWALALIDERKGKSGATIVHDGKEVQRFEQPLAGGDKSMVMRLYSADNGILLYDDYTWEIDLDRVKRQTPIPDIALSPDGQRLAYVVDTGKVRSGVYLVLDGQEGTRFRHIMEGSLEFSSDNRHFAYFADYHRGENTATLVYDGREFPLKGIGGSWVVRETRLALQLSPDGRYAIFPVGYSSGFGDYKQRYRVIDMQAAQGPALNEEFVAVAFSKDGSKHVFVEETPNKQQKVQGFDNIYFRVESLALSEDGSHSAWAANFRGKWVAVKDGQHGKPYLEIQYLTMSPDGKRIAYAARNDQKKWVFVVDETEWGPYEKVEEPRKDDYSQYYPDYPVFFSPDSQHAAATVKQDKLAGLVVDGTVVASFKKMGTPVFSPDGKRTAVWASDGEKEFIVLDGKALPGFKEIDKWQIVFGPDGQHIAYKAKVDKQWFVVVDGTPSANGFEAILTTHADRKGIVFSAPDSLYYVGTKDKMLYLIDEKIEAGPGGAK